MVIVTFSDRGDTLRILHRVRELAPGVPVVVRAREQDDAAEQFLPPARPRSCPRRWSRR